MFRFFQKKILRPFLFSVLLLGGAHSASALTLPVSLRCISITTSGDVLLSWVNASDGCTSFSAHYIYASQSPAGPYALIDSVKIPGQTTYLHSGANALSSDWYYFIQTGYDCSGSLLPASDTLHALRLTVTNMGNGIASLVWNSLRNPLPTTSGGLYRIYREYPAGTWVLLDSTVATTFSDTIVVCSANINYRIELFDSAGCSSVSSVSGSLFTDQNPPFPVTLDSVSVDTNGKYVHLGWQVGADGDISGYIIYRLISSVWSPTDTVYGKGVTSYVDSLAGADAAFQSYRVAAFDSCGNLSPLGNIHSTMFLTVALNACNRSNTLTWNSYQQWTSGVKWYYIFVQKNGGPYTLLDSVPGSTTTGYTHTGLNALAYYCYFVRAADNTGAKTSSSNKACVTAAIPVEPKYLYIKTATFNGSSVRLDVYVETGSDATQFLIRRSENPSGPFTPLQSVFAPVPAQFSIVDATANPSQKSYYYRVEAIDNCSSVMITSNTARTIFLSVKAKYELLNVLTWNDYEGWPTGTQTCYILRSIDGVWGSAPVGTELPGTQNYDDNVSAFIDTKGDFCYQVMEIEAGGNPYGFQDTSYSNVVCVAQYPRLFVPNAFTPNGDGLNDTFRPSASFVEPGTFHLVVGNTWFGKIFESHDLLNEWDGKFKGTPVPENAYPYSIEFTGTNGKIIQKSGTVTVIR